MKTGRGASDHVNPAAHTRIKLCGMFRMQDIDAVAKALPDMCGFIVDFPRSHRSVTEGLLLELCRRLDALESYRGGGRIVRVGVFVDKPAHEVARIAAAASLDAVQLHGSEDAAYVTLLRDELRTCRRPGCGVPSCPSSNGSETPGGALSPNAVPRIIQAFRMEGPSDAQRAQQSLADMVLLDSGQGAGSAFDWTLASHVDRPYILAGGLTPKNVGEAIRRLRPWGVDMSSGIETNRLKDPVKMKMAVSAVQRANNEQTARIECN